MATKPSVSIKTAYLMLQESSHATEPSWYRKRKTITLANPVALKATFSRNTAVEKKATTLAAAILERTGMLEWFYLTLEISSKLLFFIYCILLFTSCYLALFVSICFTDQANHSNLKRNLGNISVNLRLLGIFIIFAEVSFCATISTSPN